MADQHIGSLPCLFRDISHTMYNYEWPERFYLLLLWHLRKILALKELQKLKEGTKKLKKEKKDLCLL